ncbi:MAG: guanine nucleotide exchange protein for ADP-robosylation factor [Phylliscum demangeonii]|nr:MAG: guanine nucleotide exchange protein for ADP-robosylation factor [Phylliscum demangeonii]
MTRTTGRSSQEAKLQEFDDDNGPRQEHILAEEGNGLQQIRDHKLDYSEEEGEQDPSNMDVAQNYIPRPEPLPSRPLSAPRFQSHSAGAEDTLSSSDGLDGGKAAPESEGRELPALPAEASGTVGFDADMRHSVEHTSRQVSDSSRQSLPPTPRPRSDSQSTGVTNGTQGTYSTSSLVFIVNALEAIASSKEARKRKQLADSSERALNAIKQSHPQLPDPEVMLEPLQLATISGSIPLATTALDSIGKLISHSYLSLPRLSPRSQDEGHGVPLPLIERAIDTIIDCFQGEATPAELQLQIVKSLLAAVLNDKIVVHGAGLLKAVRQTYNIFLLSKSSANQHTAQGALTQMVGTVFERLKLRLSMKEARANLSKLSIHKGSENHSQIMLNTSGGADDVDGKDREEASESSLTTSSVSPSRKGVEERITLQSFENRKSFDDEQINDNAPTMVTRAPNPRKISRQRSKQHIDTQDDIDAASKEDDEDEIYIKDAFLVFRAMCKLSIKTLPPDQLLDLKSHGMRSKLLSLHLVHTILNNNMAVFISPLATIRSSSNDEPSTFLHATKQYLCLSLSRNGASSVNRVFEVGCEIFWLMLKHLRVMLKADLILGTERN